MTFRAVLAALCLGAAAAAYEPLPHRSAGVVAAMRRLAAQAEAAQLGAAPMVQTYMNDTIAANGWISFRQTATAAGRAASSCTRYYAAGFDEGRLLQRRIWEHRMNSYLNGDPAATLPAKVTQWVDQHVSFMQRTAEARGGVDMYWAKVGNFLCQLEGIAAGYDTVAPAAQRLTSMDIFLFNFQYEVGDVQSALSIPGPALGSKGGCSSFVRPTATDLFHSHATWAHYRMMLRVYKEYAFDGVSVGLSGFPGVIHSGDDFYVLSSKLSVIETTNINYNTNLSTFIVPETVSEFLRVMVANQLATDGWSWADAFCRYNSGTYSNQWMAVNHALYVPGTPVAALPDGILTIAEQMPGMCPIQDTTHVIRKQGYWGSYNIPYTHFQFVATGNAAMEAKYGSVFAYNGYARAVIMRREAPRIADIEGAKRLIRFNEWQTDAASRCPGCNPGSNPMLTVASRGDLIPANGTWGSWAKVAGLNGPVAFGALDGKVAAHSLFKAANPATGLPPAHIVSGPTHQTQIPFRWSTSPAAVQAASHMGQSDNQAFDWLRSDALFVRA